MAKEITDSFCLENVKFNQRDLRNETRLLSGTFKGKVAVAIKKLPLNCFDDEDWKHLTEIRDDNLVLYHQCSIKGNARYLVMDLCEGSMLDYCRKNLDDNVAKFVKAVDIMWQIICGIDYLKRHEIYHGDLKLENVLFWKRNSSSKRIVVKISGYGYKRLQNQKYVENDLYQLGCLCYSAATKEEAKPKEANLSLESLTEIEVNHRELVLDLINLLIKDNGRKLQIATLTRHPLFIRCSEDGKSRLIKEMLNEEMCQGWKSKQKLQNWKNSLKRGKNVDSNDEVFDDFIDILLLETKDISQIVGEALRTTPKLFLGYIWYLATDFSIPDKPNQIQSIEIQELLGKGNYGKVYKCNYTDENAKRYSAACKKCNTKQEGNIDMFNREIQTLRQLNHLFVIKYLDVVEKSYKKFIVMELCNGSLKDYVEGKLEEIPIGSLDEKILVSQMALGLTYIHHKGIIHKDLKLANILLKRQSPRLVLAKIADFGFAKELKPGKVEFSETLHPGTENYMAPELLNAPGDAYPVSFASDVYALGITIARTVKKGDHPFSSNKTWRTISMVQGLVPPNLQELSWDLIDLILKLTDKDPGKRPEMKLVLRHPYFILTNGRTKRYFVDQLCNDLELLSNEDRQNQLKKIFNDRNFQEWYHTASGHKPDTAEEITEMAENLKRFRKLVPEIRVDTLYPAKEYAEKIKEAITSDYDADIESQINQMSSNKNLSHYGLYKLVQHAPKLLVPYVWFHLLDLINNTKLIRIPTVNKDQKIIQQKQTAAVRIRRQSSKTKPFTENTMISEMEWSSLFYEENELSDELWNIKYRDQVENSSEMSCEIIGTVAKCNVTEKVWTTLLNRFGRTHAVHLLHEIVQSNAFNGPEITKLILQRCGPLDNKISLALAASNEGDWAIGITKVLLEYGGNPNAASSPTGWTPIHSAARNESHSGPEIMKLLLEQGGNPNARTTPNGYTPIHFAAANQGDDADKTLKQLLDSGGACDTCDVNQFEPIHLAVMNSGKTAPQLLDLLLKNRGSKVTFRDTGMSLVHFAMYNNGDCVTKILNKLFENGSKPDARNKRKQTPLHLLAANNHDNQKSAIMKILVKNGGNPNAVDELGRTPVHYAAANQKENAHEILKFLLGNGGSTKIKEKDGFTPVHCALLNTGSHGNKIRELVGVDKESTNACLNSKNGNALLHHVVANQINTNLLKKFDLVQIILNHGGNPNIKDKLGRSPVFYAVLNQFCDNTTILDLLLRKGGNPNLPEKESRLSTVHYVASNLSDIAPEQMKILLKYGGDGNIRSKDNITPLHLAAANKGPHGPNLIRILLDHQGNPNAVDVIKRTPLQFAIQNENDQLRIDIVLQLLEKGGNPNYRNGEGLTPVHYVVCDKRCNSLKVLKHLLQYGGDINKCNNNGMTPLALATQFGSKKYCRPEVKTYLLKMSRQMRKVPMLNSIREYISPRYIKILKLFKAPVGLLVIVLFIYISLVLFFYIFQIANSTINCMQILLINHS